MRFVFFLVFCVGVALGLWWLAFIGFILFESTCVTWLAAVVDQGNHNDHGP